MRGPFCATSRLAYLERRQEVRRESPALSLIRSGLKPMNQKIIERDDLIGSFAQHRQVLLKHTADALRIDPAMTPAEREEREAKLSAILVSSLEQLKVAEEELIER